MLYDKFFPPSTVHFYSQLWLSGTRYCKVNGRRARPSAVTMETKFEFWLEAMVRLISLLILINFEFLKYRMPWRSRNGFYYKINTAYLVNDIPWQRLMSCTILVGNKAPLTDYYFWIIVVFKDCLLEFTRLPSVVALSLSICLNMEHIRNYYLQLCKQNNCDPIPEMMQHFETGIKKLSFNWLHCYYRGKTLRYMKN